MSSFLRTAPPPEGVEAPRLSSSNVATSRSSAFGKLRGLSIPMVRIVAPARAPVSNAATPPPTGQVQALRPLDKHQITRPDGFLSSHPAALPGPAPLPPVERSEGVVTPPLLSLALEGVQDSEGVRGSVARTAQGNYVRHNFKRGFVRRRKAGVVAARKRAWKIRRGEEEPGPLDVTAGGKAAAVEEEEEEEEEEDVEEEQEEEARGKKGKAPAVASAALPTRPDNTVRPSVSRVLTVDSVLKDVFRLPDLREGQRWVIDRVLAGNSTLLVAPTGSGKSLTYQLPSLLLEGMTIVVSPLISLMHDQMQRLPKGFPAACLSGMDADDLPRALTRIIAENVKLVYMSPEKLVSDRFKQLVNAAGFPPVSLVCVDEAHCLSEWSHNFRPSYLNLARVITEVIRPRAVLAVTATATSKTVESLARLLGVPQEGILCRHPTRSNLSLGLSCPTNPEKALAEMLAAEPFASANSVIVYVNMQEDVTVLCEQLKSRGIRARAYHGGLPMQKRTSVQNAFMANKCRVVVATVALGMGLDKPDIRAIIHFNLPRSLEDFVQQIGRAGRDGKPAFCHMFLSHEKYLHLRSLCHSDGCDLGQVQGLLEDVLDQPSSASFPLVLPLDSQVIENTHNLKFSVAETLLHILQTRQVVEVLPSAPRPYASKYDPQVIRLRLVARTEGIDAIAADLTQVTTDLERRAVEKLDTAYMVFNAALKLCAEAATSGSSPYCNEEATRIITKAITSYFSEASDADASCESPTEGPPVQGVKGLLALDVASEVNQVAVDMCASLRGLPVSQRDPDASQRLVTGHSIARILQGVQSPLFPAADWKRYRLWGRRRGVDFSELRETASLWLRRHHPGAVKPSSGSSDV